MFNVQCAMCNDKTEGVVKLEKLLKKCIDIFFDMSEKGYPKDLTDGVLRLIIDLRNDLEKQKKPYIKRVTGYVCKGEDYSTRDEHGRFTGSVPHGSESSSGGGSGDNTRNKLVRGKYPVSNDQINSIIENELSGVKMSFTPVYNGRIASAGKTVGTILPTGRIKIKSMEIGKQYSDTKEALIDTIVHEELEARIMVRSRYSTKFSKLNTASDSVRHKYINRVIKKYFKMKGWDYGLV